MASFAANNSFAKSATDAAMAESALKTAVRGKTEADRTARLEELKSAVDNRTRENPNQLTSGRMIFSAGLSVRDFSFFVHKNRLDVTRVELKMPYDDRGNVQTVSLGMRDLYTVKGSIAKQTSWAINRVRQGFLNEIERLDSESERAARSRMALGEIRIYQIGFITKNSEVQRLNRDSQVAVILLDIPDLVPKIIDQVELAKQQYQVHHKQIETARAKGLQPKSQ